jgi:molybdenum cofactor biosynthesis protein B
MSTELRVATITASDTRTHADDEGGKTLREALAAGGLQLGPHRIVREDLEALREAVREAADDAANDAVVVTGGTGFGPRDITVEAITPLLAKVMDGFGEAFRRLSWDEVGERAMLSRAVAGTRGGKVIFALPGSVSGVRLGAERLVVPVVAHAVSVARGGKHGHRGPA